MRASWATPCATARSGVERADLPPAATPAPRAGWQSAGDGAVPRHVHHAHAVEDDTLFEAMDEAFRTVARRLPVNIYHLRRPGTRNGQADRMSAKHRLRARSRRRAATMYPYGIGTTVVAAYPTGPRGPTNSTTSRLPARAILPARYPTRAARSVSHIAPGDHGVVSNGPSTAPQMRLPDQIADSSRPDETSQLSVRAEPAYKDHLENRTKKKSPCSSVRRGIGATRGPTTQTTPDIAALTHPAPTGTPRACRKYCRDSAVHARGGMRKTHSPPTLRPPARPRLLREACRRESCGSTRHHPDRPTSRRPQPALVGLATCSQRRVCGRPPTAPSRAAWCAARRGGGRARCASGKRSRRVVSRCRRHGSRGGEEN
jgi:hypothetical protein